MVATAHTVRQLAFMAMPLECPELNTVYAHFVRPGLTDRCGLECLRADEMHGSTPIVGEIRVAIATAAIVVAELTGSNANVLYEIGLADGIGTPVLLIAQRIEDVPFDLRDRRVVLYTYSPAGCRTLEIALPRHVRATIGRAVGGSASGGAML